MADKEYASYFWIQNQDLFGMHVIGEISNG